MTSPDLPPIPLSHVYIWFVSRTAPDALRETARQALPTLHPATAVVADYLLSQGIAPPVFPSHTHLYTDKKGWYLLPPFFMLSAPHPEALHGAFLWSVQWITPLLLRWPPSLLTKQPSLRETQTNFLSFFRQGHYRNPPFPPRALHIPEEQENLPLLISLPILSFWGKPDAPFSAFLAGVSALLGTEELLGGFKENPQLSALAWFWVASWPNDVRARIPVTEVL